MVRSEGFSCSNSLTNIHESAESQNETPRGKLQILQGVTCCDDAAHLQNLLDACGGDVDQAANRFFSAQGNMISIPKSNLGLPVFQAGEHNDMDIDSSNKKRKLLKQQTLKGSFAASGHPEVASSLSTSNSPQFYRYRGGRMSDSVRISQDEFAQTTHCSLALNVLPEELANRILMVMMQQARKQWEQSERMVYGKQIESPRLSTVFRFNPPSDSPGYQDFLCEEPQKGIVGSDTGMMAIDPSREEEEEHIYAMIGRNEIPSEIKELMEEVRRVVSDRVETERRSVCIPMAFPGLAYGAERWYSDLIVANLYRSGQDTVAAHSDYLSSIGPLPIIAGLSLGAARIFTFAPSTETSSPWPKDPDTGKDDTFGVRLPHNSLAVMYPPNQEEWKHCIPREHRFPVHEVSGEARLSLTFRMLVKPFQRIRINCRCGKPAVLKPVMKGGAIDTGNVLNAAQMDTQRNARSGPGRYFWSCADRRCGFFEWLTTPIRPDQLIDVWPSPPHYLRTVS
eukprot:Clim_evm40s147 gene=Clim_evmTU40s147